MTCVSKTIAIYGKPDLILLECDMAEKASGIRDAVKDRIKYIMEQVKKDCARELEIDSKIPKIEENFRKLIIFDDIIAYRYLRSRLEKLDEERERLELRKWLNQLKLLMNPFGEEEPSIVAVNKAEKVAKRIIIVGDLHGDYESLSKILYYYDKIKQDALLIFLGDYVDRGPNQLKCLIGVLSLKEIQPDKVLLLRGNHECVSLNLKYGFYDEIIEKYGKKIASVFYRRYILEIYKALPYMALIEYYGHRILCVHGGPPLIFLEGKPYLPRLEELSYLPREVEPRDPIVLQILWNDVRENIDDYAPSLRSEGIYYIGRKLLRQFLDYNRLSILVRGHEPVPRGYKVILNGKVFTIFTCRYYNVSPKALVIEYVDGKLKFRVLRLD